MGTASGSMMLHCGAELIERDALDGLPEPVGTDTYFPIAHRDLLSQLEDAIDESNMEIVDQSHGLTKEGDRYFGVLQVQQKAVIGSDGSSLMEQFGHLIGIRNAHDKSISASVCMGQRVFVCDNMSFSGEIQLSRRHTKNIMRDLPGLVSQATAKLIDKRGDVLARFENYKQTELTTTEAHHLIVTAAKQRALPKSRIMDVVQQWEAPNHAEFEDRNAWSLYNAFTEVYKQQNLHATVKRSQRLNGLLDQHTGYAVQAISS